MTRPTLLFLTDLANGAEGEDILISNYLRGSFQVFLAHPADCETIEDRADVIIVRNTWNEARYGKPSINYYARFRKKGLKVHHDLYEYPGEEKDYLLDLYQKGYPVIPTVDSIKDLDRLGKARTYFIKPKDGFDAINARKISRSALLKLNPRHYLIQPFIDFEHEMSFYYLDKKLQYAMRAPEQKKRWELKTFKPSAADLRFAGQFIHASKQRFGIERVDACRLKDGSLLLMELTDCGGVYLSIKRLDEKTRARFLENLKNSLLGRTKQP